MTPSSLRCQPSSGVCAPVRSASRRRHVPFSGKPLRVVRRAATSNSEVDLDAQVEMFMKRQAELESGAAFARARNPDVIIGGDVVTDEVATKLCRDIFDLLKTLKASRDMSLNEVKLIVQIEDPRAREQRAEGIEDERGVSRDEMAAALMEVAEGRVPKDRIALKCLHDDITNWPFLRTETAANQASTSAARKEAPLVASDYASLAGGNTVVKPYVMGDKLREGDKPQSLSDMLPDWVGFGVLYGVSAIPVLLAVGAVLVLFWNSLK